MRINKLSYYPYKLSFKAPLNTADRTLCHRNGFLVVIEDIDRLSGIGEVAPFEEFGSESYYTALNLLDELSKTIATTGLSNSFFHDETNISFGVKYPAVKHGIEQALFHLQCRKKDCSLNKLTRLNSRQKIKLNALIVNNDINKIIPFVKEKIELGFRTFKLKIGNQPFEEDVKLIDDFRKYFQSDIALRLDVNGKWNRAAALKQIEILEQYDIEYIEQPVSEASDFLKLSESSNIPIAADESIRSVEDADEIIKNNFAQVLILKPMMLGGLLNTLDIMYKGEAAGKKIIITSSFDSALSRNLAAYLASVLKEDNAHGLDTGHFFVKDISPWLFKLENSELIFTPLNKINPTEIIKENEALITHIS